MGARRCRARDTRAEVRPGRLARPCAGSARARDLNEKTSGVVALLPSRRGRHLEEIPPNFLQKVKTLHEERGWGRGRILEAMRAEGAKEWMVRRALAEIAGGNAGSSRSAQATFSNAPPRKEAPMETGARPPQVGLPETPREEA
jgi:hypothetical protein